MVTAMYMNNMHLNKHCYKDIEITTGYRKGCSVSQIIRKMKMTVSSKVSDSTLDSVQRMTTIRYCLVPARVATI